MANQSGTAQIPSGVLAFYDRNLLERATPALLHDKFGQQRTIPKNNSDSIKFRRWNALPVATTPLVEGVTPVGSQMSVTDITATLKQYGDFTVLTDKVQLVVEDKAVKESTDVLGEQAGETIDEVTRDAIVAGTAVIYASGVAGRASVAAKISEADVKAAIKLLKNQNAKKFTTTLAGSVKVNTYPVRAAYVGIVAPDTTESLEDFTKYRGVEEYASQQLIDMNEVGTYKDVRFVETSKAKVFAGAGAASADVYATMILGKNSYGVVSLRGMKNIQTIIKPLGSAGTTDPLDQRSSVGWKAWSVTKILNDQFMVRIESAQG